MKHKHDGEGVIEGIIRWLDRNSEVLQEGLSVFVPMDDSNFEELVPKLAQFSQALHVKMDAKNWLSNPDPFAPAFLARGMIGRKPIIWDLTWEDCVIYALDKICKRDNI